MRRRTRILIDILKSSSSGNCYLISDGLTTVAIECGIQFREWVNKVRRIDISGVFVSHEHKDHSKIASKLIDSGLDLYTSKGTAKALKLSDCKIIKSEQSLSVGTFDVMPFEVEHDAVEPLGFLFRSQVTGEKVLFATDTYYIKYNFKGLNYMLIECNFDHGTLEYNIQNELIPEFLKKRLLKSHFSLRSLKKYIEKIDGSDLDMIYLIHKSAGNLNVEKAVSELSQITPASLIYEFE